MWILLVFYQNTISAIYKSVTGDRLANNLLLCERAHVQIKYARTCARTQAYMCIKK